MKVWSDSFENGSAIPSKNAMGKPNPTTHAEFAGNKSPHVAWSGLPEEARSLALIFHDGDVPTRPDDVNQEGRTVPRDLPRADFSHWLLVDLKPGSSPIAEGEFSEGITAHGKDGPAAPHDCRQGLNDYTSWFSGNADMEGKYFGYDGPFPPWNDERIHVYRLTLYALDVDRCPVEGEFDMEALRNAMDGHIVDQASWSGSYHIYPNAK